MASYGVRILENSEGLLKFRLVILNPDFYLFPRTHAFGLFILWEGLKQRGWKTNDLLGEFLTPNLVLGDLRAKAPIAVSKMIVSNFQKLREPFDREKIRSRINAEGDGFKEEDLLPSADYELQVRMPAILNHLDPGMIWVSEGKEMDEMRHYLEKKESGENFFIDSSMDGKFHLMRMGKEGEEGETIRNRTASYSKAQQAIDEKTKEGYQLVYQNFDSPFGTEFEILRLAEE